MNTIWMRARCVAGCAVVAAGVVGAPSNGAITYYSSSSGDAWTARIDPATYRFFDLPGSIPVWGAVDPEVWASSFGVHIIPGSGIPLIKLSDHALGCNTPTNNLGWFSLRFDQPIRAGFFKYQDAPVYLYSSGQLIGTFGWAGTARGFISDEAIDEIRVGDPGSGFSAPRLYWGAYATPIPVPGAGLALLLIPRSGRRRRA